MTFEEWLEKFEIHTRDPYSKIDKWDICMFLEEAFEAGLDYGYEIGYESGSDDGYNQGRGSN